MWCVYEVCVVNLTGSRSFATAPMNPIEHTLTDRVLFGFGQKATETETCCWVCEKVLVSVQGKHAVISSALPVSTKRAPACATSACFFKARRISSPHLMHEAARSRAARREQHGAHRAGPLREAFRRSAPTRPSREPLRAPLRSAPRALHTARARASSGI